MSEKTREQLYDELDKKRVEYREITQKKDDEFRTKEHLRDKSIFMSALDYIIPTIGGGIGGLIAGTGISYNYRSGGHWREIDNIKEYFAAHPSGLEHAKEVLGTDNIDYISGFLLGEDGPSRALRSSCGYDQFLADAGISAFHDGLFVGALGCAIPILAYYGKRVYLNHRIKSIQKTYDELSHKQRSLSNEIEDIQTQLRSIQ